MVRKVGACQRTTNETVQKTIACTVEETVQCTVRETVSCTVSSFVSCSVPIVGTMNAEISLDELSPLEGNPRTLSDADRDRLRASLARFGDLSGIVRNVRQGVATSSQLVGGNQRTELFSEQPEAIVRIVERLDEPNDVGTVAWGYVEFGGDRYSYREVDWPDEMVREASVKANKLGGEFAFDILLEHHEIEELIDFGFEAWEFKAHAPEIDLNAFGTGSGSVERDREGAPAVGEGGRSKLRTPGFVRLEFHVRLETRDRLLSTLNTIKDEHDTTLEDAIVRLIDHYEDR